MLNPTDEQRAALNQISDWLSTDYFEAPGPMPHQEFVLAGLAGTGKTTMMKLLPGVAGGYKVHYCAPTNKAASVLRSKGIPASTVHQKLYQFERATPKGDPKFIFDPTLAEEGTLFVIDEASMIDAPTLTDLRSTDARFLFVGDHGQLPPVGPDPRLMQKADVRLEKIMRQAEGSEILKFAHHVRTGGDPFAFKPASRDVIIPPPGAAMRKRPAVDIWLCWRNYTRVQLNMFMLKEETPRGELRPAVIPVQMRGNYPAEGLYNGEVYSCNILEWDQQTGHPVEGIMLHEEDSAFNQHVRFHPHNWHKEKRAAFRTEFRDGILADYGYAVTVHTSQGSEWNRIAVVDEAPEDEPARWRYTAATRAREQLIWLPFSALPIRSPSDASAEVFR